MKISIVLSLVAAMAVHIQAASSKKHAKGATKKGHKEKKGKARNYEEEQTESDKEKKGKARNYEEEQTESERCMTDSYFQNLCMTTIYEDSDGDGVASREEFSGFVSKTIPCVHAGDTDCDSMGSIEIYEGLPKKLRKRYEDYVCYQLEEEKDMKSKDCKRMFNSDATVGFSLDHPRDSWSGEVLEDFCEELYYDALKEGYVRWCEHDMTPPPTPTPVDSAESGTPEEGSTSRSAPTAEVPTTSTTVATTKATSPTSTTSTTSTTTLSPTTAAATATPSTTVNDGTVAAVITVPATTTGEESVIDTRTEPVTNMTDTTSQPATTVLPTEAVAVAPTTSTNTPTTLVPDSEDSSSEPRGNPATSKVEALKSEPTKNNGPAIAAGVLAGALVAAICAVLGRKRYLNKSNTSGARGDEESPYKSTDEENDETIAATSEGAVDKGGHDVELDTQDESSTDANISSETDGRFVEAPPSQPELASPEGYVDV